MLGPTVKLMGDTQETQPWQSTVTSGNEFQSSKYDLVCIHLSTIYIYNYNDGDQI